MYQTISVLIPYRSGYSPWVQAIGYSIEHGDVLIPYRSGYSPWGQRVWSAGIVNGNPNFPKYGN